MVAHLSKSKILSGQQCLRRLWLEKNRPELVEISQATKRLFRMGNQLNAVVHTLFPGGYLIEHDLDLASALKETAFQLKAHPKRPLFEATFSKHNVLVRADVLLPEPGGVHLIEVKSSTKVKPYHLSDCAIQTWVLCEAGHRITRTTLAHIDNTFVYQGDQNYQGILEFEEVTWDIAPLIDKVPHWVTQCQKALAGDEPDITVGTQCHDPFECPFIAHCTPPGPEYPIEWLPRARTELIDELHGEGIDDMRDIPLGRLESETHEWVRAVTKSGNPDLRPQLVNAMRKLPYPRYYIDFETIQFAIPIWKKTRPYEQLPFQWSCHIEHPDGTIEHKEFLDVSGVAPMHEFATTLIKAVGSKGQVLVYSHFERTILLKLSERFPDLADGLNAIIAREFDLLKAVRAGFYHPDMQGSWSIKKVLPVVTGDPGYEGLDEVKDGTSAQIGYEEAINPDTSPERKGQLTHALLEYCKLDTWAMVELVQAFAHETQCVKR